MNQGDARRRDLVIATYVCEWLAKIVTTPCSFCNPPSTMPPKKADKKKKGAPKLPVKKTIEKQLSDLEAAAAERKEVGAFPSRLVLPKTRRLCSVVHFLRPCFI